MHFEVGKTGQARWARVPDALLKGSLMRQPLVSGAAKPRRRRDVNRD
jgi:hypothetical protein